MKQPSFLLLKNSDCYKSEHMGKNVHNLSCSKPYYVPTTFMDSGWIHTNADFVTCLVLMVEGVHITAIITVSDKQMASTK